MATVLNSSYYVDARASGDDFGLGDLSKVTAVDLDNADGVLKRQLTVGNNSTILVGGGRFDFGWMVADRAVTVLWRGSTAADSSAVVLPAGEPFIFATDVTSEYNALSTTRCTGADDTIESGNIYVRNSSGSNAVVRLVFASNSEGS